MTPVMLMLQTPFPIAILWGTEGVILYNDAFAEFSGSRHPGMLGMPVREAWPEPVEMNASVLQQVLEGGSLTLPGSNGSMRAPCVWLNS